MMSLGRPVRASSLYLRQSPVLDVPLSRQAGIYVMFIQCCLLDGAIKGVRFHRNIPGFDGSHDWSPTRF